MTREQQLKHNERSRASCWRRIEKNRSRARCRKTRVLIDRARVETLHLLQQMVQA